MTVRRYAVVGGGISGLVAAYRLRQACGPAAEITLVEESTRLGGTLRTAEVGTESLDVGAEAFIGRRPEVPALLAELGLSNQLVHPSSARPLVYSGGRTHALPLGTLMGIPSSADSVRNLVDPDEAHLIETETIRPFAWTVGSDVSVADLVGSRFGSQVVSRSVDPLLGGVYSGSASSIGVRAALPTLATALDAGAASLTEAVLAALPTPSPGPVFGGLRDGYAVLLDALIAATDARTVVGTGVGEVRRDSAGWFVGGVGLVDGVVLAVPAPILGRLLAAVAPAASQAARDIELASSVVVALAFPKATELPQNSGILVATDAGLDVKAFTLSSRKWPHLGERDAVLLRASLGRFGDTTASDRSDAESIETALRDLRTAADIDSPPLAATVQRWPGGLPQYAPGHLDRVAAVESGVADLPGLEVTGAWQRGVGVPACIASATTAAARLIEVAR
ncbi:protoporphyrinogen oxidase [Rhodococcus sp. 06-235-1A]|uniref:protoporphyrinogen oxidase n=1 Tax=Rhodococcus sp. 06-235-1A TaxID=2022508 RepID=UPI000B9AE149|nr:protoporphyrinogen oxidase [Rhodococcus sp. 06-235-1A]OZC99646.1 protoporphyrinogen oxidase [Rhodococcus sp. 06-235-1A]